VLSLGTSGWLSLSNAIVRASDENWPGRLRLSGAVAAARLAAYATTLAGKAFGASRMTLSQCQHFADQQNGSHGLDRNRDSLTPLRQ
jgi:hypothetical protein